MKIEQRGGRIRSPAGEPRPGKQSTGLFAWTGLSNPPSEYPYAEKDQSERIGLFLAVLNLMYIIDQVLENSKTEKP